MCALCAYVCIRWSCVKKKENKLDRYIRKIGSFIQRYFLFPLESCALLGHNAIFGNWTGKKRYMRHGSPTQKMMAVMIETVGNSMEQRRWKHYANSINYDDNNDDDDANDPYKRTKNAKLYYLANWSKRRCPMILLVAYVSGSLVAVHRVRALIYSCELWYVNWTVSVCVSVASSIV